PAGGGADPALEGRPDAAVRLVTDVDGRGEGPPRDLTRSVARAVVHEDDLARKGRTLEEAHELAQHRLDAPGLVVGQDDDRDLGAHGRILSTRAGLPAATAYAGTSRVTTAPAPICAPRPTVTPGRTIAPIPRSA